MHLSKFKEIAERRRGDKTAPVLQAFDAAAGTYDQARRALVPDHDALFGAAMSRLPANKRQSLKVLDIGSGTGIFAKMVADAYPHSRIIVSDASEQMLAEARQKLGRDVRYEFEKIDVLIDPLPANLDIVVSSFVIHHFDHADKRAVFGRIFRALSEDGVFVNVDQASSGSEVEDEAAFQTWLRDVKSLGVKPRALKQARERMQEHDKNAPLTTQARWLEEIGFRDVDVPYSNYFWAVFAGRK
jgi:tRNA (cmo5U34)-methyltransferase